jgi:hypothetical protein
MRDDENIARPHVEALVQKYNVAGDLITER